MLVSFDLDDLGISTLLELNRGRKHLLHLWKLDN